MKNIIITNIIDNKISESKKDYTAKDKKGNVKTYSGYSQGEAGIKYVISNKKIDKIYVIGKDELPANCNNKVVVNKDSKDDFKIGENDFIDICNSVSQFLCGNDDIKPNSDNDNISIEYVVIDSTDEKSRTLGIKEIIERIGNDFDDQVKISHEVKTLEPIMFHSALSLISIFNSITKKVDFDTLYMINDGEIIDVSQQLNTSVFISGIDAFIQHGKVDVIEEICDGIDIQSPLLKKLLMAIEYVDAGISINDISVLREGIYSLYQISQEKPEDNINKVDKFLFLTIMSAVTIDIKGIIEDGNINLAELVLWALRKGCYQQALTIIEALLPEDIVTRGIYYYAQSETEKEEIMENWNERYWKESSKNRYIYNDLDHMYIKTYLKDEVNYKQPKESQNQEFANKKVEQLDKKYENYVKAYTNLSDTKILQKILASYYNIGTYRNHINHAESSEFIKKDLNDLKPCPTFDEVSKVINDCIIPFKQACDELKNRKDVIKPVKISNAEFKEYRNNHNIYKNDNKSDNNSNK